ncbi:MAG: hypothetical protein QOH73_2477 [Gaiellaceae bacterium]|nr:hypothetical protein [Gaiellaceae bacterium]
MGKASRTKKERVKAPTGAPTSSSRPAWLLPVAGGGLVIAIIAIVLALTLGGGGSSSTESVSAALKAAGCTLRAVKPLPPKDGKNYHNDVPTLTTKVKWSTDPPSAGGHFGAWAVWNFYYEPVNPRMVVHNEEHGGMIMWWGPKVSGTDIDKMYGFYQEDPLGMLGTPYPSLGSKIALTAWTGDPSKYYQDGNYGIGHIALCTHFDQKAFTAFRDAYRGKGPEGISLSQDVPGSGPQ